MFRKLSASLLAAGSLAAVVSAAPVRAQVSNEIQISLPAQDLSQSLRAVSLQTGRNVIAPDELVKGRQAPAISGPFTAEGAVRLLLAGSGLEVRRVGESLVIAAAARPPGGMESESGETASGPGDTIVVTGTRIRGGPVASPVIEIGREEIRNAGQSSLGEVVRSLPQSFGGGQNPGVGTNVPASSGVDVGGGSSIDLRGLGSDATLTLLNGHRLSYSASRQSVDVSAIPLGAVERIEILADGASAIYGSDAVAGVANVILRRRFDGLETSARVGSSTDGGDFQQLYGGVAGADWRSGGIVVAYEYGSNSPIESKDRSYAATRSPGLTLSPALRHHSASLNAHQQLSDGVSIDLDGLFNRRNWNTVFPLNFAGDLSVSSGRLYSTAQSYELTPALHVDLGGDWRATVIGSYGHDRVDFAADLFFAGVKVPGGAGYYTNAAKSVEVNGDGSVFRLPGGNAKLALGGGYRMIDFAVFKGSSNFQNAQRSQDSYHAFGELSLPLVSTGQHVAFVDQLFVSAALRYENYPGIGDVATPKVGIVYAPSADFALKSSWGRSFRAPTLLQQYNPPSVSLLRAASVGGAGLPAAATVLLIQGGNAALKPERAETWSATLEFHPRAVHRLKAELSYFSTRYRDRIVTPIAATAVALSNPINASLVVRNPTAAAQSAAIARAGTFVNAAGGNYDPANVVAIIDDSNVNAGRQVIDGVDLLVRYGIGLGADRGTLSLLLDAAYLKSKQQLTASQPLIALAGTLFNPPHFRTRGGLTWAVGPVMLTGIVNYSGPVTDTRFTPSARIGSITTADLTARLTTGSGAGPLRNVELSASVLNAFNAKPTAIRTTLFTDTPYDSTNYSPVGRFITFGITRKW
ncbi:MAG TPA: TonB-dependent receptor [Allosphingosinicella sp.]|jgi:outer membrane receptor protein involved in Fe transport|nr:TonB-dependent receptor [Allosphingosinicella sp.]